jgi:hypothetical protein
VRVLGGNTLDKLGLDHDAPIPLSVGSGRVPKR